MSPSLNLLVLRSPDIERAVKFYRMLGLSFTRHRHGNGPEHYAVEEGEVVFEIYPVSPRNPSSSGMRLGFRVSSVAEAVENLRGSGYSIVSEPMSSPWGLRAVVDDPDGNRVELLEPISVNPPSTKV